MSNLSNQKGVSILAGIVIILASAFLLSIVDYYHFVQMNKETNINVPVVQLNKSSEGTKQVIDTSDWQVHENKEYGYFVSFPAEWYETVIGSTTDPDYPKNRFSFANEEVGDIAELSMGGVNITIDVNDRDSQTLDEFIKTISVPETSLLISEEDITISDQPAFRQVVDSTVISEVDARFSDTIYVINGDYKFTISIISLNEESYAANIDIFNKILSIFQFLE